MDAIALDCSTYLRNAVSSCCPLVDTCKIGTDDLRLSTRNDRSTESSTVLRTTSVAVTNSDKLVGHDVPVIPLEPHGEI